ncbi:hypothetical protein DNTS_005843, partial [Danionella cerebrum]
IFKMKKSTNHREEEEAGIMSVPPKQERTVCVLLPTKETLDITVGLKATGQEVFHHVCERLGVKELHYFGLTLVKNNEHIFLDLEEKLSKYFPKEWKQDSGKGSQKRSIPPLLCLKVQYYVENGRLICERKARKLYYFDLRERVLRSECRQQEEVYFQLAGFALQADHSDHPAVEQGHGHTAYFQPKEYFPPWIIAKRGIDYLLCHGPKVHKELWGMSSRDAILLFIRESCRLEDVPVTFYRLQKDKNEEKGSALLGLTLRGMQVYQELNNVRDLLYDFPWFHVGRLTFLGKRFEIQPDGLPSARKLVYYTGSAFRSRHLLLHLSSCHRLYLSLQPALKHLRQLEETEEKKRYRESYISDELDLDHPCSEGSPHLSRHSTTSSGIEADTRQHNVSVEMVSIEEKEKSFLSSNMSSIDTSINTLTSEVQWHQEGLQEPGEVSVDDPVDLLQLANLLEGVSVDCPTISSDNDLKETDHEQIDLCKKDGLQQIQNQKIHKSAARCSFSLDDVRRFSPLLPLGTPLDPDTSISYTFGLPHSPRTPCTDKPSFSVQRSTNCFSLDLLDDSQLLELTLFDTLSWPVESRPGIEEVEALTILIKELSVTSQEDWLVHKVRLLIWNQCMPLLPMISCTNDGGKDLLTAVCALFAVCVSICPDTDEADQIINQLLPVLTPRDDGSSESKTMDMEIAIEVTAVLLSSITYDRSIVSKTLSCTLCCVRELSESVISKIIVRIWFTILKSCREEAESEVLLQIWEDLLAWFQREQTELVSSRLLLCLTALSDHLFSSETSQLKPDPRKSQRFFRAVQNGLKNRDSVTRKRALYLLTRCVALAEEKREQLVIFEEHSKDVILFSWTPEKQKSLREFWENYALVLETLEENQIHVIRPVLSRIDTIVERTAAETQGGLFSPSWLLCVYQRMFNSENKAVMKEGVSHLLKLKILRCPGFASAFSEFVIGPLMDVLAESSLYHRAPQQNFGEGPELEEKLQMFMVNFFNSLPEEDRGSVVLRLIQRMGSRNWCAVPLLFLTQALSCLPSCPILKSDGLLALREVLCCTMITHQVLLRGASQCFLLQTALSLTDVSRVSLDDVFAFIVHLRKDESLCRGSTLWKELCYWLQMNETHFILTNCNPNISGSEHLTHDSNHDGAVVFSYVRQRLKSFLSVPACSGPTGSLPDGGEAELLARAVLLTADLQKEPDLNLLLQPLLDVLQRLGTNVYLPLQKSDRSLQILLMLEFLLRKLSGELKELFDMERSDLYLAVLKQLTVTYSSVSWFCSNLEQNYFPKLTSNCLRILNEASDQNQVQKAVSMATLALLCQLVKHIGVHPEDMRSLHSLSQFFCLSMSSLSLSSSTSLCLNQTLPKPTVETLSFSEITGELKDWGRVVALYIRDQWTCLCFLRSSFPQALESPEVLRAAVDALSLLPGQLLLPLLEFMATVLPQQVAQCEYSLCVEALTSSWKAVQSLSSSPQDFWRTLHRLVRVVFDRRLLELTKEQNPTVTACIEQIVRELIELAQVRSGVFNVVIQHCCETWLPPQDILSDTGFSLTPLHLDILTEACLFKRSKAMLSNLVMVVLRTLLDNRDDQFPRVCVVSFLCRLNASNRIHLHLMEELVLRLLNKDAEISKSKVRYYSNSIQHRVKNRVWQTLLLLLHKLPAEFVSEVVFSRVCEAGFVSNQASVKYLIEWAMILVLHQNPSHIQSLWNCFSLDHEKTKTSICTFLSVLVHMGILLPKLQDKELQWRRALELSLQCCFSHNFSVRLYALLALRSLWQLRDGPLLMLGTEELTGLSTLIQACLQQAEGMQNTGPYSRHFLVSLNWQKMSGCRYGMNAGLPLMNSVMDLNDLQPGDWIQQDRGDLEQDEHWVEVQKKISPWNLSVHDQEPELVAEQRASRLGKHSSRLLVVASLINKPTNLGGLCRTCEIFGAKALVLDNLRHVQDKQFQALSVSSELWLPMLEVKPAALSEFLQLKKSEGYWVIGVEQTSNSQSLQDYSFPEKSLLLLGNEREGIPANLLQLVDVCVEIPQLGITRSLNVHVSAALLVWEYTRQHSGLMTSSDS